MWSRSCIFNFERYMFLIYCNIVHKIVVMEITVKVFAELKYLNSRVCFHEEDKGFELLDYMRVVQEGSGTISDKLLRKIREEAVYHSSRSKSVLLKWLIFLHQVLQTTKSAFAAETVMSIFEDMSICKVKSKFEEYLVARLLKPYQQYLKKLAGIAVARLRDSGGEQREGSPEEKEERKNDWEVECEYISYCQYNLMNYACRELHKPVNQFYGFFQKEFPCLNGYICLLNRDIRKNYQKLKAAFEKGRLPKLTYLQIENLSGYVNLFGRVGEEKKLHSWLLTQTQARSEKVQSKSRDEQQEDDEWPQALMEFQQN